MALSSRGLEAPSTTPRAAARGHANPAILLAALWSVVAGGDPSSWLIGAPTVAVAAWSYAALRPASSLRISLPGLGRFVPFFLWESLRGGIDVASQTLRPRMRIRPGFTRYRTRLSSPAARVFFASCASLVPGTLGTALENDEIEVHVLIDDAGVQAELRRLERAVADLFGAGA